MNPVRRLRQQVGMTQQELASLAGTSQPTIAAYEAGRKSPSLNTVHKLAKALGLEMAVVFVPPLTREDQRSLAYHRAVAEILKNDPQRTLLQAHRNLEKMYKLHRHPRELFEHWQKWLELPIDQLIEHLLDVSLVGRDMRQVTPFSGALSPQKRVQVLKAFRKEFYR